MGAENGRAGLAGLAYYVVHMYVCQGLARGCVASASMSVKIGGMHH